MVGVDGGGRVDLQTVVVLAGVFKQTVHRVQDLVGQQEEPLPAGARGGNTSTREHVIRDSVHMLIHVCVCNVGTMIVIRFSRVNRGVTFITVQKYLCFCVSIDFLF